MSGSVYLEAEFLMLVALSLLAPCCLFVWLVRKRKIARATVAVIGAALVLLAAVDAILLQRLSAKAKATPELADDRVFASEFSIALFILPLMMAGMGVNLMSHVLHEHLIIAELEYERRDDGSPRSPAAGGGNSRV
jgi:hypothetical protein